MAEHLESVVSRQSSAVAAAWALETVANILAGPSIAVHDAVEIAADDPRSLIGLRRELEFSEPRQWRAIKCGRVKNLVRRGLTAPRGNLAARVKAALSRQGVTSHLQAILTWPERSALLDLIQLLRTASRVKPLGAEQFPGACSRVRKSRAKGALARMLRSANARAVFQVSDDWLGCDPSRARLDVFERVLSGHSATLGALSLSRAYATGDYRWRFLLGYIMAERV